MIFFKSYKNYISNRIKRIYFKNLSNPSCNLRRGYIITTVRMCVFVNVSIFNLWQNLSKTLNIFGMLKEQFLLDLRLHLTFNSNGKLEGCPK